MFGAIMSVAQYNQEAPKRSGNLILLLVLYFFYSWALLSTYVVQLAEANVYEGWQPWAMSLEGWFVLGGGLPLVIWMTSRIDGRPSDFFRLFLGSITLVSFLLLHSVVGPLPEGAVLVCATVLLTPLLLLEVVGRLLPLMKNRLATCSSRRIDLIIMLIFLGSIFAAYLYAPASAGFGLDDSFVRRLEGRSIYMPSSLLAYALGISMNGFTPFLAFRAALKGDWLMLGLAAAAALFFFWLVGVKAPFAYLITAYLLGHLIRQKMLARMALYFLCAVLMLWLIVLAEWWLFGKYSYIADYLFRRVFPVQALDQAYYLKFLFSDKAIPWSWLSGSLDPDFRVTYFIGESYAGNINSNSNTNAFINALAAKGLIGYLGAIVFVPLILVVFDRLWQSSRNPSYLFLGFLYGLLVIEQAYTVAMVSSGVGLLFLLVLFENSDYVGNPALVGNI
jgi:hypothetical protein